MTDAESDTFPLMRLPAEIRLRIYQYCLPSSQYYECWKYEPFSYVLWERGVCSNLIYTSRQIHKEGMDVFYGQNRFRVPSQRFKDYGRYDITPRIIYDQGNRVEHKTSLIQCRHFLSRKEAAKLVRHLFFQGLTQSPESLSRREREALCLEQVQTMHGIGLVLSRIPRLELLCIVFTSRAELDLRSKEYLLREIIPNKPFMDRDTTAIRPSTARINSGLIFHHPKPASERFCNGLHYGDPHTYASPSTQDTEQ